MIAATQWLVACENYAPVGFEALVVWDDAELGSVAPADFIPVAEEMGLIVRIGEMVLRRACHEAMSRPRPLCVAVNLSAVQFRRKGLLEMVGSLVAEGVETAAQARCSRTSIAMSCKGI